jgi:hypothetical protein
VRPLCVDGGVVVEVVVEVTVGQVTQPARCSGFGVEDCLASMVAYLRIIASSPRTPDFIPSQQPARYSSYCLK